MKRFLLALPLLLTLSCQPGSEERKGKTVVKQDDPHSYAKPNEAVVKHLDLDIKVDFNSKQISGKASWTIENSAKGNEIIFDSRQLTIEKVTADNEPSTFALGDSSELLGRPLTVSIKPGTKNVTIWYHTSANAAALQWLTPQQTAGKKLPFLFTQSQAILARTWIPCQDSPGIRFTYNATAAVPKELIALMSAENPTKKNTEGIYHFKQPHPIPSYLMALAVGDIAFESVDERTGVYAEPVTLAKAAHELADMGEMVKAAETLYGNYKWGRYDVLILPPSFPFGGMENPMLTFATPTIIAGDRSLVSLVAHELAHSWSGNLVTNATWNDFWLNEGFTTYFERRIVEEVYGKEDAQMQELLARQDLLHSIAGYGENNPDTRLKADFTGRDPDLGVSDIAYEKGYSFLRTLEEAVGRNRFDAFIKDYFNANAFKSITTEEFIKYLKEQLLKNDEALYDSLHIHEWIYEPGIPNNIPPVEATNFNRIDSLISIWQSKGDLSGFNNGSFNTNEKIYLIRKLPDGISLKQLTAFDQRFKFTVSENAEVQTAWYTVAIRKGYSKAYPYIERFLTEVGRRKFLMPLYGEMVKTNEGKKWALQIYEKARPNYHSVSYNSLDALLGYPADGQPADSK